MVRFVPCADIAARLQNRRAKTYRSVRLTFQPGCNDGIQPLYAIARLVLLRDLSY
jgi:hypothetical protein